MEKTEAVHCIKMHQLVLSKLNLFKLIFPWLFKDFFLCSTLCLCMCVFLCMDEKFVPSCVGNICKKYIFHWQWQHARNIPQVLLSRMHVCLSSHMACRGGKSSDSLMHIYKIRFFLQCGVMSTQCAVCFVVERALVETPNETIMLKYCNLFHRVLFFKGLVIRGFIFIQQMLFIHTKVLQRGRET